MHEIHWIHWITHFGLLFLFWGSGYWVCRDRMRRDLLKKGLARWEIQDKISGTPVLIIESFNRDLEELANFRQIMKELGFYHTHNITKEYLVEQVGKYVEPIGK